MNDTVYLSKKHFDEIFEKYLKNNCDKISLDLIESFIDKNWNWQYISKNPNLTIDFVEKYIFKPLNWNWNTGKWMSRPSFNTSLSSPSKFGTNDWHIFNRSNLLNPGGGTNPNINL